MSRLRLPFGWLLGLAAAATVAAGSRGVWKLPQNSDGVLRLTLSARPERLESCRRLTEAELARRPVHMRQSLDCDGRSATYRLRVWSGSRLLGDEELRGGGLRRDRPIHLLRDYPLTAGNHVLRIELGRIEPEDAASIASDTSNTSLSADRGVREAAERQRRRVEALPALVELTDTFSMHPGAVTLVTWDPVARALRVVSPTGEQR